MIIELADHAGFCFGVKQAVDKTMEVVEENQYSGRKIFTFGPLIHNPQVVEELKEKGVFVSENIEDIPTGSILIIRSHGVPENIYQQAEDKAITIIDSTCPFVKKVQKIVSEEYKKSNKIVIIGDPTHPEVIGINGWCNNEAIIISDITEAENIKEDNLSIVAQTTIREETWNDILEIFKNNKKTFNSFNTICNATKERQKSCEIASKHCNAMIVIGGKNSSNTKKLYDISKKYCKNTFFIERKEDLPLLQLEKCNKIGVTAGASTPECIIKEVIATMSEFITDETKKGGIEENEMYALMDEIEKSLRMPGRGEIVTGEIISANEKEVVVNLGCKKDGIIPKDEVTLEPGQKLTDLFKVGDKIEVKVLKTKDDEGNILLSKKKMEVNEHWNEVNDALENKSFVNAKVTGKVKGGVIATFKEISGFIPLSQLSDRFTENVDEYIGKTIPVKVIQTNQKRNRAVFSHRAVLMEEKAKKTEELWGSIKVDDMVDGVVKRFTDYGAFVDIGGVDGLLHISEISWGKIKKPQDVLKLEEVVKVKILSMNQEKGKISLGLKQTTPEPWENIDEKFKENDVIEGKVVQLKDYGAFIEIEPGLDGLVHISEIAYKRVANPANELQIGQIVSAKILEIDKEKKRISLSIKETLEKPEDMPEQAEESEEPATEAVEVPAQEEEAVVEAEEVEVASEEAVEAPADEAEEVTEE